MKSSLRNLCRLAAVLALAALPAAAGAADIVLLAIGSQQGAVEGDVMLQGHENWINVFSFSHSVSTPIDAQGQPTGPAITSPFQLMTEFDSSTIGMFNAQVSQEVFSVLTLEWLDSGTGQTLFRFELQDARVLDAQESGSSGGGSAPIVSLSFVYARIDITNLVLGTTASYDWNAAPAAAPQTLAKGLLLAPSPNPTQGQAEFRFSLPTGSNARLALYDLRGHLVRELHAGYTPAEPTTAVWDGTDDSGKRVAQGMYVARLTYSGREVTQRITVLR